MGFSYENSKPEYCKEVQTLIPESNYINRTPICRFLTDSDGNILLEVTNLRIKGNSHPTQYGVIFGGIVNGKAGLSSTSQGENTGVFTTFYEGSLVTEVIYANEFSLTAIEKNQGVKIYGVPPQNNAVGDLVIEWDVGF